MLDLRRKNLETIPKDKLKHHSKIKGMKKRVDQAIDTKQGQFRIWSKACKCNPFSNRWIVKVTQTARTIGTFNINLLFSIQKKTN